MTLTVSLAVNMAQQIEMRAIEKIPKVAMEAYEGLIIY